MGFSKVADHLKRYGSPKMQMSGRVSGWMTGWISGRMSSQIAKDPARSAGLAVRRSCLFFILGNLPDNIHIHMFRLPASGFQGVSLEIPEFPVPLS